MRTITVAAVFARGGSKGLPGKNLRVLAGSSLLERALRAARATPSVDHVIVSTEDAAIAEAARRAGGDVPFRRPAELARDDSPEWAAWQHAVRHWRDASGRTMDVLVSVPTTAPLRRSEDVEACVQALREEDADAVITVTPATRSPHFNMVVLDEGYARVAMSPERRVQRRQEAPPVYDVTTVAYAARASFVLDAGSLFEGRVRAVVIPPERAIDIDTELDLKIADCLLRQANSR